MLDSQKYPGSTGPTLPTSPNGGSSGATATAAPSSNAPDPLAFADAHRAAEEILAVSGAAWAEYHLLLGEASPQATRINREIRTFGGAPTIAVLLARWAAESKATEHIVVALNLVLGRDPNARLLRRELESWASRLPSLRLDLTENLAAPEVAYRILLWPESPPEDSASTCRPQILQCGEIGSRYSVLAQGVPQSIESSGGAGAAAAPWAWVLGVRSVERRFKLAQAAGRAWEKLGPEARIGLELSWAEVEAEAEAVERENS